METNRNSIGFFDSGVGGLTVFEKVKKMLPNQDYIYFGDLKNSPYGEKSKQELIKIADTIFKFFENKRCKSVIMACNTTSAQTYEELKDKYNFKIYPIIQSCANVIAKLPIKKIGVFATAATISSKAYSSELKKYNPELEIFEQACPDWVKIVEKNVIDDVQSVALIEKDLKQMMQNNPEKIILGCTHYPYLMKILTKFVPEQMFIDPSETFAKRIVNDIDGNNTNEGSEEFFVSTNPEGFFVASKMFYELKKLPTVINL